MTQQSEENANLSVARSLERLSTQSELNSSRQDMFSALSLYNSHANIIITMMLAVLTALGYFLTQDIQQPARDHRLVFFMIAQLIFIFSLVSVVVLHQYYDLYVSILMYAAHLHKKRPTDPAMTDHPWLTDLDQFDATKNSDGTDRADVTTHKFVRYDLWAITQLDRILSIVRLSWLKDYVETWLKDYVEKNRLDGETVNSAAAQVALRSRRCLSTKYSLVPYSGIIAVMGIVGSLLPIVIKDSYGCFSAWHAVVVGVFGLGFFVYGCFYVFQTPLQRFLGVIWCVFMAMWLLVSFIVAFIWTFR